MSSRSLFLADLMLQHNASFFAGDTTANHDVMSRSDRCEELTDLLRIDFADRWSSAAGRRGGTLDAS